MIQVISTAMIVFIGIGLTILVVAILAMGILWFYGSFWTTGLVSLFSGNYVVASLTFMFIWPLSLQQLTIFIYTMLSHMQVLHLCLAMNGSPFLSLQYILCTVLDAM